MSDIYELSVNCKYHSVNMEQPLCGNKYSIINGYWPESWNDINEE